MKILLLWVKVDSRIEWMCYNLMWMAMKIPLVLVSNYFICQDVIVVFLVRTVCWCIADAIVVHGLNAVASFINFENALFLHRQFYANPIRSFCKKQTNQMHVKWFSQVLSSLVPVLEAVFSSTKLSCGMKIGINPPCFRI